MFFPGYSWWRPTNTVSNVPAPHSVTRPTPYLVEEPYRSDDRILKDKSDMEALGENCARRHAPCFGMNVRRTHGNRNAAPSNKNDK